MSKRLRPVALLLIITVFQLGPTASARAQEPDWKKTSEEAVELLTNYLRVDTTNPPGNEARAAAFFARILEREGIAYSLFETAPGRSILYARLKGSGANRALVLLNHTDVVPAEKQFWSSEPFGALVRDGSLFGRGALDMKSMGAAQFMAFLLLKRAGAQLARDVVFLATPDEETGGRAGAGWMVQNHPELLRDCEFLITEGSSNLVVGDHRVYYGIGVTEKTPCWLKLTARGTPGHGSVPRHDSAPSRLLRALGKLEAYQPAMKAVPAVARYFRALGELQSDSHLKHAYSDVASAVNDPKLRDVILTNAQNVALLSNTIQPTVVNIGTKTNVIAPIATAELDCRLLPGEKPDDFVAEIRKVIADPGIEVEKLLSFGATESPVETDLYHAMTRVIRADDPNAVFVPTVLTGFTDSHYFRDLGVVAYGFSPFLIQSQDYVGVHGNDERIPVVAVGPGVQLLYRIVRTFCSAPASSAAAHDQR